MREEQGDELAEEAEGEQESARPAAGTYPGRADEESRITTSRAFGFYLVFGVFVALLVVVAFWLLASLNRGSIPVVGPGMLSLA